MRNPFVRTHPASHSVVVSDEWKSVVDFSHAFFATPLRPFRWFALRVAIISFFSLVVAYFTYGRWHIPLHRFKEAEK